MTPYERALSVIEAEHGIVDVVYNYIDRMNDPDEEIDPMEKIAQEFVEAIRPAIDRHLATIGRL